MNVYTGHCANELGFWTHENQTEEALSGAKGKTLVALSVASGGAWHIPGHRFQDGTPSPTWEYGLLLRFADGTGIYIYDDSYPGKSMDCDDDLSQFVRATFLGAEVRDGPAEDEGPEEVHEIAFLVVFTSLGEFTVATHNYHNGYYSGFMLEAGWLDPEVVTA